MSNFLAGQIVADPAHLKPGQNWKDASTWAPIALGSARGLNRLLGRDPKKKVHQEEFEQILPSLVSQVRARIESVWMDRSLQAFDLQNLLAQFDQYRRLQMNEGTVRSIYPGASEILVAY